MRTDTAASSVCVCVFLCGRRNGSNGEEESHSMADDANACADEDSADQKHDTESDNTDAQRNNKQPRFYSSQSASSRRSSSPDNRYMHATSAHDLERIGEILRFSTFPLLCFVAPVMLSCR
jgi:hypothetical protein